MNEIWGQGGQEPRRIEDGEGEDKMLEFPCPSPTKNNKNFTDLPKPKNAHFSCA